MKRFLLFVSAALLLAACTTPELDDPNNGLGDPSLGEPFEPEFGKLKVTIEERSTRAKLQHGKTVFSRYDPMTVYFYSDVSWSFTYEGEDGTTEGYIAYNAFKEPNDIYFNAPSVIVIYPYNVATGRSLETDRVWLKLPVTQYYHTDSFGIGSSVMVGVANRGYDVTMKSLLGYHKLSLKGNGETIDRIDITSNDGKPLAGAFQLDPNTMELIAPTDEGYTPNTAISLSCIDGVTLTSAPTDFYFALPEGKYDGGFTYTLRSMEDGSNMVIESNSGATIKRGEVSKGDKYTYDGVRFEDGSTKEYVEALFSNLNDYIAASCAVNYDHSDYGYHSVRAHMDFMTLITLPCTLPERGGNPYYSRFQFANYGFGFGVRDSTMEYVWHTYMPLIDFTNLIITTIGDAEELSHYKAMAQAYRALFYNDLAMAYDALPAKSDNLPGYESALENVRGLTVPIVKEDTTEAEAENNPRATREAMYEFILGDLDNAEKQLENYTQTDYRMPSLAAVYALKARVYLWLGGFEESYDKVPTSTAAYRLAAEYADKAINSSGASVTNEYDWTNPFTAFNSHKSSWLWESVLTPDKVLDNLHAHVAHFCPEASYSYGPLVCHGVSSKMYDRLGDNDIRKRVIAGPEKSYAEFSSYTSMGEAEWSELAYRAPYTNFKFRPNMAERMDYNKANAISLPIIRIEEAYFIKMEATAHFDESSARSQLENFMTTYRDSDYSFTGSDIVEEIIFHKSVEFWGEGVTMADMKRLDMGVNTLDANYHIGMRFKSDGRLPRWNFVIPASELAENMGISDPNPDPSYDLVSHD